MPSTFRACSTTYLCSHDRSADWRARLEPSQIIIPACQAGQGMHGMEVSNSSLHIGLSALRSGI